LALLAVIEYRRSIARYVKLALAVLPSIALALTYVRFQAGYKGHLESIYHYSLLGKIAGFINTWAIGFAFDGEQLSALTVTKVVVNLAFACVIILIMFKFARDTLRGGWRTLTIEWVGVILFVVAVLLPTMFYYVTAADTRLFFASLLLILPAIGVKPLESDLRSMRVFGLAFLLITSIHIYQFSAQGLKYREIYQRIEAAVTPNSKLFIIMGDFLQGKLDIPQEKPGLIKKVVLRAVPDIAALMRIPYYYYVKNDIAYPHIFQTSIFESRDDSIPLMINPYPSVQEILDGIDTYDYVVIVGKTDVVDSFSRLLQSKAGLIENGRNYAVLKIERL